MSIVSEINRLTGNISDCYDAVETKGGTLPAVQNSDNLAAAIQTITGGGGGSWNITNADIIQTTAGSGGGNIPAQTFGYYNSTERPGDYISSTTIKETTDVNQLSGCVEFIKLSNGKQCRIFGNSAGTQFEVAIYNYINNNWIKEQYYVNDGFLTGTNYPIGIISIGENKFLCAVSKNGAVNYCIGTIDFTTCQITWGTILTTSVTGLWTGGGFYKLKMVIQLSANIYLFVFIQEIANIVYVI